MFILYHIISFSIFVLSQLRLILLSSPLSSLFNWPRVQLYLKVPNHIKELTFWSDIIHCLICFGFVEYLYRSSHPEVFCTKGVFGNFTKFTGKHLCQQNYSNIHRKTPGNFAKFLGIHFYTEYLWSLLLFIYGFLKNNLAK